MPAGRQESTYGEKKTEMPVSRSRDSNVSLGWVGEGFSHFYYCAFPSPCYVYFYVLLCVPSCTLSFTVVLALLLFVPLRNTRVILLLLLLLVAFCCLTHFRRLVRTGTPLSLEIERADEDPKMKQRAAVFGLQKDGGEKSIPDDGNNKREASPRHIGGQNFSFPLFLAPRYCFLRHAKLKLPSVKIR